MTARKQDFEKRYFDQMDESSKEIRADIKEVRDELRNNTNETRKINSRVSRLEIKVFPSRNEALNQLPPFYRDPQLLKIMSILAACLFIGLVIFATVRGIQLPKGLF